jgi:nitrite reductase/ring-hydroxylating ferredoxin subunit
VTASTTWSVRRADVPPGTSAKFTIMWRGQVAEAFLVNFRDRFYAHINYCMHAGTPLDWWPNSFFSDDGRYLICGTHGSRYEPDTGACADGPCNGRALHSLDVTVTDDRVIVTCPNATTAVP